MKRTIIEIDEDKCVGCEKCVHACHEGALVMVDGKARVIGDLLCDGLGACLDVCDFDALKLVQKDTEPYNEEKVMQGLVNKGDATVVAHLNHLKDHKQYVWYNEGVDFLIENNMSLASSFAKIDIAKPSPTPCQSFNSNTEDLAANTESFISQWPIQLRLISPANPAFVGADFVLVADCVAFTYANFANKFLKNKKIAIACPKLDEVDDYIAKLVYLIDETKIASLTVAIMEVPCCGGLWYLANSAIEKATRKIPVKKEIVSIKGNLL